MILIFTYGTLQNKKIQLELFNRILKGSPDILLGYQKDFIKLGGNVYPILKKINAKTETQVQGTCYEISLQELYVCDAYEGTSYQRVKTTLKSGKKVWVYIAY